MHNVSQVPRSNCTGITKSWYTFAYWFSDLRPIGNQLSSGLSQNPSNSTCLKRSDLFCQTLLPVTPTAPRNAGITGDLHHRLLRVGTRGPLPSYLLPSTCPQTCSIYISRVNLLKQWPDLICLNLVPECQGGVLALWLSYKPYRSVCLSKLCSWHHHHNQQQQTQGHTHLLELQTDLHCPLRVTWLRTLYCEEFHCLDFLPSIRSQGHSLQEGHPLQEAHSDHLTHSLEHAPVAICK